MGGARCSDYAFASAAVTSVPCPRCSGLVVSADRVLGATTGNFHQPASTSPTSSTRAPASLLSPWAWSSSCCWARSTCGGFHGRDLWRHPRVSPHQAHGWPWWVAVSSAVASPALSWGCYSGLLVARLGIPSFVVTLAAFLVLQGVLLRSSARAAPSRSETRILSPHEQQPSGLARLDDLVIVVAGDRLVHLSRPSTSRAPGLGSTELSIWAVKLPALAMLLGALTYYLSIERSNNPASNSIKGVPEVVVLLVLLVVGLSFAADADLLRPTRLRRRGQRRGSPTCRYQRAEHQAPCFMICSAARRQWQESCWQPQQLDLTHDRGGQTLLYAVGAAVIGGTSLFGGKGRTIDAIIGGLVVAVIANGMPLLGSAAAVVYMVTGLVLLLAASVDALSRRRSVG